VNSFSSISKAHPSKRGLLTG